VGRRIATSFVFLAAALLALSTVATAQTPSTACTACHPRETAAFQSSPMGRSISDPADEPDGRVRAPRAHTEAIIRHKQSHLTVELTRGSLRASWTMAWSIGAGLVGRTDIVQIGDYLFQSPVSWYAKAGTWDLSPGYEQRTIIDLDRPVVDGCLFCHAGAVALEPGAHNRFAPGSLKPIGCERCHGPAAQHLSAPGPGNIVNPAKLNGAARDSVCEQCHLEGESRVLNPGRDWWDFRAGAKTEDIFVTYVKSDEHQRRFHAVSHSEQLAQSRCARASGGSLWCGSCHDPHGDRAGEPRKITTICLSCHQQLFAEQRHQPAAECIGCHMPRLRADNVSHAAITDHTIPGKPVHYDDQAHAASAAFAIVPWRKPRPQFETRDDGLARIDVGEKEHDTAEIRRGYRLLTNDSHSRRTDLDELKAIAAVLLEFGEARKAAALFADAERADPRDAQLASSRALALEKSGDLAGAIREFRRAIQIDRSLPEPYLELANIYSELGNESLRRGALAEYLKFMPQSIRFRLELHPSPSR
jgi:predicted CXXCH cytochrome family protein